MFGMEPLVIGHDILDIGSRKATDRSKRQLGMAPHVMLGQPGAFDVPNVPDVRFHPLSVDERLP